MNQKNSPLNYILIGLVTLLFLYLITRKPSNLSKYSQGSFGFLLCGFTLLFFKVEGDIKLIIPFWIIYMATVTFQTLSPNHNSSYLVDSIGGGGPQSSGGGGVTPFSYRLYTGYMRPLNSYWIERPQGNRDWTFESGHQFFKKYGRYPFGWLGWAIVETTFRTMSMDRLLGLELKESAHKEVPLFMGEYGLQWLLNLVKPAKDNKGNPLRIDVLQKKLTRIEDAQYKPENTVFNNIAETNLPTKNELPPPTLFMYFYFYLFGDFPIFYRHSRVREDRALSPENIYRGAVCYMKKEITKYIKKYQGSDLSDKEIESYLCSGFQHPYHFITSCSGPLPSQNNCDLQVLSGYAEKNNCPSLNEDCPDSDTFQCQKIKPEDLSSTTSYRAQRVQQTSPSSQSTALVQERIVYRPSNARDNSDLLTVENELGEAIVNLERYLESLSDSSLTDEIRTEIYRKRGRVMELYQKKRQIMDQTPTPTQTQTKSGGGSLQDLSNRVNNLDTLVNSLPRTSNTCGVKLVVPQNLLYQEQEPDLNRVWWFSPIEMNSIANPLKNQRIQQYQWDLSIGQEFFNLHKRYPYGYLSWAISNNMQDTIIQWTSSQLDLPSDNLDNLWKGISIDKDNYITITLPNSSEPEALYSETTPNDYLSASFYFYIMGDWPEYYLGERQVSPRELERNVIDYLSDKFEVPNLLELLTTNKLLITQDKIYIEFVDRGGGGEKRNSINYPSRTGRNMDNLIDTVTDNIRNNLIYTEEPVWMRKAAAQEQPVIYYQPGLNNSPLAVKPGGGGNHRKFLQISGLVSSLNNLDGIYELMEPVLVSGDEVVVYKHQTQNYYLHLVGGGNDKWAITDNQSSIGTTANAFVYTKSGLSETQMENPTQIPSHEWYASNQSPRFGLVEGASTPNSNHQQFPSGRVSLKFVTQNQVDRYNKKNDIINKKPYNVAEKIFMGDCYQYSTGSEYTMGNNIGTLNNILDGYDLTNKSYDHSKFSLQSDRDSRNLLCTNNLANTTRVTRCPLWMLLETFDKNDPTTGQTDKIASGKCLTTESTGTSVQPCDPQKASQKYTRQEITGQDSIRYQSVTHPANEEIKISIDNPEYHAKCAICDSHDTPVTPMVLEIDDNGNNKLQCLNFNNGVNRFRDRSEGSGKKCKHYHIKKDFSGGLIASEFQHSYFENDKNYCLQTPSELANMPNSLDQALNINNPENNRRREDLPEDVCQEGANSLYIKYNPENNLIGGEPQEGKYIYPVCGKDL